LSQGASLIGPSQKHSKSFQTPQYRTIYSKPFKKHTNHDIGTPIGFTRTTLGKANGIAIGNMLWGEYIENLRNMLITHWELDGNT
jgi:hypothetical protein